MGDHLAVRFHRSCRCWDGLAQKQLELHGESGPMIVRPWLLHRAETSEPQIDAGSRPRPCKPHPSRRRRASRRCGNAKWFDRSWVRAMLWRKREPVNESRRVGGISREFLTKNPHYSAPG